MTQLYFTESQSKTLHAKLDRLISQEGVTEAAYGVEYSGAGYYAEWKHNGNYYHFRALTTRALNAIITKAISNPAQYKELA